MYSIKLIILSSLFLVSCLNSSNDINIRGSIFGTYYLVKGHTDKEIDLKLLQRDIDNYLNYLNMIFSTYDNDSELSKLNQLSTIEPIRVSFELKEVLLASKKLYEQTKGYFDVTVGPIVNAYGFGPIKVKSKPSAESIKEISKLIGSDKFNIDKSGLFKKSIPSLYIDLSAIAKGYAVDKLLEFLVSEKKIKNVLVEIGGEVKAVGKKQDGSSFRVGIEKPSLQQEGKIIKAIELENLSMATSGNYRNIRTFDDLTVSHTIDPLSKEPVKTDIVSATVLHESCMMADAYATALMAMGSKKALEFSNQYKIQSFIIVKNEDKLDIMSSDTF